MRVKKKLSHFIEKTFEMKELEIFFATLILIKFIQTI